MGAVIRIAAYIEKAIRLLNTIGKTTVSLITAK